MALSSRIKNTLMDAINITFNNIGKLKPTKPPHSDDNTAPIAWELFVSTHVLALAKKRKDIAHEDAVKAGIIFDHVKYPRTPDDNGMLYVGDQVGVYLSVKNPGKRVNIDKFCDALMALGVREHTIDEARQSAVEVSKPAHEFKVSLITEDALANGK